MERIGTKLVFRLVFLAALSGLLMGCGDLGSIVGGELNKAGAIVIKVDGSVVELNAVLAFPETIENETSTLIVEVENQGDDTLHLTGAVAPVSLQGSGCFTVGSQPDETIPAQGSVFFQIDFQPVGVDSYDGTVTIDSDDPDVATFMFSIAGSGIAEVPPVAPGNVIASDGTSIANVMVTWDAVDGANLYYLYRSESSTPPAVELVAPFTNAYTDTSAVPGTAYNYWVRAYDPNKTNEHFSDYSTPDAGYRKLSTPSMESATDGTSTTSITVTWSAVTGADSYDLYRTVSSSETPGAGTVPTITGIAGTSTSDTGADPAYIEYYWVRACADSSSSTSAWSSTSASGYLKLAAPANLSAYQDAFDVDLSWSAVPGADEYIIYRSLISPVTTADEYNEFANDDPNPVSTTSYEDYYDVWGQGPYYYRVRARNTTTGSISDFSNEVAESPGYAG